MAFDFTGKKILVTGAGRGIGRALALELAAAGAEVYALSRTKETLDTLSAESDRIHPIVADLSDWDKTRQLVDELDVMDGVVNNAAYLLSYFKDGLDYPKDELERSFQVNILGTINIIQSTGKKMVAAGKGGSIVNISSVLGLLPCKGAIAYDVSKAALDMVTKQFALELGPHQVRVNSVNLTVVKTEKMVENWDEKPIVKNFIAMTPMGRLCSLKDSTGAIKYLLSDHSTMVSGTTQVVDGGLLSHIPV